MPKKNGLKWDLLITLQFTNTNKRSLFCTFLSEFEIQEKYLKKKKCTKKTIILKYYKLIFFGAISSYPLYLLWRPEASGLPQQDTAAIWARNYGSILWLIFESNMWKGLEVKYISGLERELIVTKNTLVFYIKKLEIDSIVNLLYNFLTFVFPFNLKVKFIKL